MINNLFLNLTDYEDTDAIQLVQELRDIVMAGERHREARLQNDDINNRFWRGEIWSKSQLDEFAKLDIVPYEFGVHRALINNLISRQRSRRFTLDVVPNDITSYKRFRDGMDRYVAEHIDEFETEEEAREYYQRYADDNYSEAVSAMLQNVRYNSKAKYVESTVFQQSVISGLDFFKATYSTKYNREGSPKISRRPQRAIFYDETSTEFDLSDIEYIGEVHLLYKNQLILQYPDRKEEIENLFEQYTNFNKGSFPKRFDDWQYFYNYDSFSGNDQKVRVAELWFLETEQRYTVYDNETNETRVVEFDKDEEVIAEELKTKVLLDLKEKAFAGDQEAEETLMSDNIEEYVEQQAVSRFDISTTYEPIWYKAVFSFNALFELKRSPYPHNSHPYYPSFAHFSEGYFHGLMDDIRDVVTAINKALSFREVMMAHGSKGLVVVDRDAMMKSEYDIEDIAEHWSSIGSVLAIKLKPGQRIRDIIDSITTVGEGLDAINFVLQDLDNRLYQISGVNLAQLGIVERETTASGYRQQLAEGEANNGLIFDNFVRSLEGFYNDKVVPLVAQYIKDYKVSAIRQIGEQHKPWLEIELDEGFGLFEEAIRAGHYNTVLIPMEENPQRNRERSAQYMELAMAGALDLEVALEFSDDPNRHKIIKRQREKEKERFRRQVAMQAEIPIIQQIMLESGVGPQKTAELIDEIQRQTMLQMAEQEDTSGRQNQLAQNTGDIQTAASESERLRLIENQT